MSITISRRMASIAAAAAVSGLVLAGCADDEGTTEAEGTTSAPMTSEMTTEETSAMAEPAGMLVGPGCADYAEANPDGPGSVDGMAMEPVATAASNNPLLTTLTAAVSGGVNPDVDLVDTLNNGEYTVFAPVDDAFAQVDQATMDQLGTDADLLTTVLTYHVVEGQISPEDIEGMQTTLAGEDVDVTGSGDELMVNGANVICGGVQTANATVYLVDEVLMPPM
ncbi:fasciclin domain-containing protein [Dietzia psychralcaliphila]|uniref:Fasciclin n=1 Tax=Dietzia psychralcaliphila TaxID=139021 RepID=A0AAD0JWI7_9ACTN|nr:fasciclin domain-containing protein [Dietzia psychralcaliphila]AWH96751.1 fasciclin [Dietzia psychralcaliphila]PTM89391.1 putative surface protein with fasciclin (FAS1) repeats [Dietzia psychralcaliphila]